MVWVSLSMDKNDFLSALPPKVPGAKQPLPSPKVKLTEIVRSKNNVLVKQRSSSLDNPNQDYNDPRRKIIKVYALNEAEDILESKPPADLFTSDSESCFDFLGRNSEEYSKNESKVNITIHPVSEENSLNNSISLFSQSSNGEKTSPPTQEPLGEIERQSLDSDDNEELEHNRSTQPVIPLENLERLNLSENVGEKVIFL